MIIKGKSRSNPGALATHLGNAEKNERVQLVATRGTIATDLRGALVEMDTYALGTKCVRSLYHAALSPEPPHRLTPEQRLKAVDELEKKLGLDGNARVIVLHEKLGREHLHVVWSRIDIKTMKSASDSHNYRKHEEVARALEREFGHARVQGAHHERDGVARPDRTPSRAELRQEERTGISGKTVKAEVTAAFKASDGPEAFRSALEEKGYLLAKGDRRDFVVIDREGGVHSLARRLEGQNAKALREFMGPLAEARVPSVKDSQQIIDDRKQRAAEIDARHKQDQREKSYGRGDDYVTQATAAQRDFKQRQKQLNRGNNSDDTWDRIEKGERRALEISADNERKSRIEVEEDRTPDKPVIAMRDVELTDDMRAKLDRLLGGSGVPNEVARDGPDRQHKTPGGGRTRGR